MLIALFVEFEGPIDVRDAKASSEIIVEQFGLETKRLAIGHNLP